MTFDNDYDVKKFYIGQKNNVNSTNNEFIDDFLLQKLNGNLDTAKQLGLKFGEKILVANKNISIFVRQKRSCNFITNVIHFALGGYYFCFRICNKK